MRSWSGLAEGFVTLDGSRMYSRLAFYCIWGRTRNVSGKLGRIRVENLRNERVRFTFQDKLTEKLRKSETVQGEADVMWRYFKTEGCQGSVRHCR